jgi:hypothetical protein
LVRGAIVGLDKDFLVGALECGLDVGVKVVAVVVVDELDGRCRSSLPLAAALLAAVAATLAAAMLLRDSGAITAP